MILDLLQTSHNDSCDHPKTMILSCDGAIPVSGDAGMKEPLETGIGREEAIVKADALS